LVCLIFWAIIASTLARRVSFDK